MAENERFRGAKLALLSRGRVLTLQRDEKPDLPYPGHWDLPGGGRDGVETPVACVLRELHEEFGLRLPAEALCWRRKNPPSLPGQDATWFFAAEMPTLKPADITFGDEGQTWRLMPVRMFLMHPKTVPHLAERLAIYLEHKRTSVAVT